MGKAYAESAPQPKKFTTFGPWRTKEDFIEDSFSLFIYAFYSMPDTFLSTAPDVWRHSIEVFSIALNESNLIKKNPLWLVNTKKKK